MSEITSTRTAPQAGARFGGAIRIPAGGRWIVIWAASMAVLGWALMTVGAFVRASESGLGCPDWPACHGRLLAGGNHALIEEFHRWIATVLVIGVVGLALVVLREHRRERAFSRPVGWMLALLALQVVLGGVTVLLNNVSWKVVAHYGGASLLVASITLVGVRLAFPSNEGVHDSFSRLVGWFAALSFGLLLAGSTVANTDSHTACGSGFPLCNGSLTPSVNHQTVINMTHRIWAGAVLILALYVLLRSRRDRAGVRPIAWAASAAAALFVIQGGVGIAVLAIGENTAIDVFHSSIASLTWLPVVTLLWLARTLPAQAAVSPGLSASGR